MAWFQVFLRQFFHLCRGDGLNLLTFIKNARRIKLINRAAQQIGEPETIILHLLTAAQQFFGYVFVNIFLRWPIFTD